MTGEFEDIYPVLYHEIFVSFDTLLVAGTVMTDNIRL